MKEKGSWGLKENVAGLSNKSKVAEVLFSKERFN